MEDNAMTNDWIVRLQRRRDGKRYFYRNDGCTTALAHAIASQHPDFTACAMRYDSKAHKTIKEKK